MTDNDSNNADTEYEQETIFRDSPKIFDIVIEAFNELPQLILHCEVIDVDIDNEIVSIPLSEIRIVKEQTIYCPSHGCYIHITFV